MISVTVLHVGDFRESYFREAEEEYRKRLQRFCAYRTVCIPEERVAEETNPTLVAKALEKEAVRIRAALPKGCATVALCVEGKQLTSEAFAELLREKTASSLLCFVIGSSHGLDERFKRECDFRLSLSALTFPHRLARLLLAEQVYRGFTILSGGIYHK